MAVHPFLRLSAVGVPQSTHRAWFPRPPLKFRASGFPTTRLQVTTPPDACPRAFASGDRRIPALCRAAGSALALSVGGSNASAYPPSPSRFASDYGCDFVVLGCRSSVSPPMPSVVPWVTHGPFPRPRLCCPQLLRYYGPIRQTRAHGPTSPYRLYGPPCCSRMLPAGHEPFPALRYAPCARAAVHTPERLLDCTRPSLRRG